MRIFALNKISDSDLSFLKEAGGHYPYYTDLLEIIKRLKALGWEVRKDSNTGSHYICSFNGKGGENYSITIAVYSWEIKSGWKMIWQEINRQNPDLASFLYDKKFKIPENFNLKTQKFEKEEIEPHYITKNVPVLQSLPQNLTNYEVLINGKWIKPIDVDWIEKTIIKEDGEIIHLPLRNIMVRKLVS